MQRSLFQSATLLCFAATAVQAQSFINVSGFGLGTGDSTIFGPGGAQASRSVSINNPFVPQNGGDLGQPGIVGYASGNIQINSASAAINQTIVLDSLCLAQVNTLCDEIGCGSGTSQGSVTSRIVFRVSEPAILTCQGGATTQFLTQCVTYTGGTTSATADLTLVVDNLVIVYHRRYSASGNGESGETIPQGGIALLMPFVDYRLDMTVNANSAAAGHGSLGSGFAHGTAGFQLAPITCPLVSDPADTNHCPAAPSVFSVTALGQAPLTLHWEVMLAGSGTWTTLTNGAVANVGIVSGATTDTLTVSSPAASGNAFRCVAVNSCGSSTSDKAILKICAADYNCDEVVDFFDYLDFVDAFAANMMAADFNHDLILDFFDYLDFVDAFATGCN